MKAVAHEKERPAEKEINAGWTRDSTQLSDILGRNQRDKSSFALSVANILNGQHNGISN